MEHLEELLKIVDNEIGAVFLLQILALSSLQ